MTDNEQLFRACQSGQLSAVNGLLERVVVYRIKPKANVNARDPNGLTPLHYAVRDGHREIARTLLARGAEVDARDATGAAPLHYAARHGRLEIAQLLISKKANIHGLDGNGFNALSYAAQGRHQALMHLLLETGGTAGIGRDQARPFEIPNTVAPGKVLDARLTHIGNINDFVYDERDRLLSGDSQLISSASVVWRLLEDYGLFRARLLCEYQDQARSILAYATTTGGLPDMVGEIESTAEGAELVLGGDLRQCSDQWLNLVELLSRRRVELGIVEAVFYDMAGETSILIEKNPQHRLSSLGRVLTTRPA